MVLNKEKAILLLEKLEEHCVLKGIIKIPKSKVMRDYETVEIILRRYGCVVLEDDNGDRYLCNNPKYLKKWTLGESLSKAGRPLKLSLCGEMNKTLKKKRHG